MVQGRGGGGSSQAAAWGLMTMRIFIGVFFIFEGLSKTGWLVNPRLLDSELQRWLQEATPWSRWYLETVALPAVPIFARVVMLAEVAAGAALVLGFWTRLVAVLALLMVLNFHVASGLIFQPRFLTSGYGLPVLGCLLALVIGGARLPWSLKD